MGVVMIIVGRIPLFEIGNILIGRFDLIFLLVDPQDEYYDRRLATHLVSLYYKGKEEQTAEFLVRLFDRRKKSMAQ